MPPSPPSRPSLPARLVCLAAFHFIGFLPLALGIAVCDQYLISQGSVLVDGPVAAYGVQNLSTINVCARLLGGKVHGSLARAGKVKGQTPKVEKQVKKKSLTGEYLKVVASNNTS